MLGKDQPSASADSTSRLDMPARGRDVAGQDEPQAKDILADGWVDRWNRWLLVHYFPLPPHTPVTSGCSSGSKTARADYLTDRCPPLSSTPPPLLDLVSSSAPLPHHRPSPISIISSSIIIVTFNKHSKSVLTGFLFSASFLFYFTLPFPFFLFLFFFSFLSLLISLSILAGFCFLHREESLA